MHHVPARKRAAAFREMFRVTRPAGRLLVADFDTSRRPLPLHPGGGRMRRAAATVGPLEELGGVIFGVVGAALLLTCSTARTSSRPSSIPPGQPEAGPRSRGETSGRGDASNSGLRGNRHPRSQANEYARQAMSELPGASTGQAMLSVSIIFSSIC
jgi:hypothetical protein